MNRNHIILGLAGLILLGAAGCSSFFPWFGMPLGVLTEDFESEWLIGADVPEDPNCPGRDVAWSIDISDGQAKGKYAARFYLDGRQDDGTIWMTRSFGTSTAGAAFEVEIKGDVWSESASDNTLAKLAFYAGNRRPQSEADFDTTQSANQAAGWKTYTSVQQATSGADGRLWVAFGISAVWEAEMTYYFDNVTITIYALE